MKKSNKITFSLLLLFSLPVFGMEIIEQPDTAGKKENVDQKKINPFRLAAKCGIGVLGSLKAHYCLGYISAFIHEHGHGLVSGYSDYTSIVYPSQAPSFIRKQIFPWQGATTCVPMGKKILKKMVTGSDLSFHDQRKAREILLLSISRAKDTSKARDLFCTVTGPFAGIFTTYVQCIGIELLNGFIHNRPLKESLVKGIRFPFSFFSDAYKTGRKYCSYLLGKKADENTQEPSWSSVMLSNLMFWRCAGMMYECMYGLLPCGSGDGQDAWDILLKKSCPSILDADNLSKPTLGIMCIPYIIGALQALASK